MDEDPLEIPEDPWTDDDIAHLASAGGEPRLDGTYAQRRRRELFKPPQLQQLIDQYMAMLGWTQKDLAGRMGKHPGEVSRLLNPREDGRYQRATDRTLQQLAHTFQTAGLVHVTFDLLKRARDPRPGSEANPFDIPERWQRLVRRIVAYGPDIEDTFFRLFDNTFASLSPHIARQQAETQKRPDGEVEE